MNYNKEGIPEAMIVENTQTRERYVLHREGISDMTKAELGAMESLLRVRDFNSTHSQADVLEMHTKKEGGN